MGAIFTLRCSRCNYRSEELALGQGRASVSETIVGSCSSCKNLTTIAENEPVADCALCAVRGQGKVRATPCLTVPAPEGDKFSLPRWLYQCPVCHSLTVEIERRVGFWD